MTSEMPARMAERSKPEVTCSATAISSSDGSSLRRTRTASMRLSLAIEGPSSTIRSAPPSMALRASLIGRDRRQPTLEELLRFIDESGVFVDYQEIVLSDGHFSPLSCCPS